EGAVDPDLAELVDDHGELAPLARLAAGAGPLGAAPEQPVQERGLAAAEEAGEDHERDAGHCCSSYFSTTTTRRFPAGDSGMSCTISIVNGAPGRYRSAWLRSSRSSRSGSRSPSLS